MAEPGNSGLTEQPILNQLNVIVAETDVLKSCHPRISTCDRLELSGGGGFDFVQ
jgi:hypothetical protein